MTIIFYDLASAVPEKCWSPNTWKVRYALNLKGIAYETEWVEYPDIESVCKRLSIPPTTKNVERKQCYTLPAIHDLSTGVAMSDSLRIIEYLEETYPNRPTLFPHNTLALQVAFAEAWRSIMNPLWDFLIPVEVFILNPRSAEYFRRTREPAYGKALEDVAPKGELALSEWSKVRDAWAKVAGWYAKSDMKGPFLLGDEPCFADIFIGSVLMWMKVVWREDGKLWRDVASWSNGRWQSHRKFGEVRKCRLKDFVSQTRSMSNIQLPANVQAKGRK